MEPMEETSWRQLWWEKHSPLGLLSKESRKSPLIVEATATTGALPRWQKLPVKVD